MAKKSSIDLLSPVSGIWRYSLMGYVMKGLAALPKSLTRKLLGDMPIQEMPPMAGMVRLLEACGKFSDFSEASDHAALLKHFPALTAVKTQDINIPNGAVSVEGRLYTLANTEPKTAVVWVHGGAFVGGDLDFAEAHWLGLALAAQGVAVLSLDYRKALHGVRYPAPLDDVLAGWHWAVAHCDQLGVSADNLHLGGASAGANLVACAAKRLRDEAGGVKPKTLMLAYPTLHAELPEVAANRLSDLKERAGPVYFSPQWVRDMNLNYTGSEQELTNPYALAGNGGQVGLPPVYIVTAENDSLRLSGEAYAKQLESAGVSIKIDCEPNANHGALNMPFTNEGQGSLARIADWLMASRE